MAYRRRALIDVGGFDECFPRPFREDADIALRVLDQGWLLAQGRRQTTHPVRPPRRWASLRAQAGNADDALMTRRHGRDWYRRADAAPGRRARHWMTTGLAAVSAAAVAGGVAGTGRRTLRWTAGAAALGWLALTAEFAAARIHPGPRTRAEVTEMVITSALIPPLAAGHWVRGWGRARHAGTLAAGARGRAVRPGWDTGPRRALQRPPGTGRAHAWRGGGHDPAAPVGGAGRRGHEPVGGLAAG